MKNGWCAKKEREGSRRGEQVHERRAGQREEEEEHSKEQGFFFLIFLSICGWSFLMPSGSFSWQQRLFSCSYLVVLTLKMTHAFSPDKKWWSFSWQQIHPLAHLCRRDRSITERVRVSYRFYNYYKIHPPDTLHLPALCKCYRCTYCEYYEVKSHFGSDKMDGCISTFVFPE